MNPSFMKVRISLNWNCSREVLIQLYDHFGCCRLWYCWNVLRYTNYFVHPVDEGDNDSRLNNRNVSVERLPKKNSQLGRLCHKHESVFQTHRRSNKIKDLKSCRKRGDWSMAGCRSVRSVWALTSKAQAQRHAFRKKEYIINGIQK